MSPHGRPKGEYRRAQPEGTPVSPHGRPKGSGSRLVGLSPDTDRPCGRSVPGAGLAPLWARPAAGRRVPQ